MGNRLKIGILIISSVLSLIILQERKIIVEQAKAEKLAAIDRIGGKVDTYKGYFEKFDSVEDLIKKNPDRDIKLGVFHEGEKLEIKGSLFRVARIIRNGLKLELLPKEPREGK